MEIINVKIKDKNYKIEILYEDNHLLVVYKPQGVLSQKDISNDDSMVDILKRYLKEKYNKPGNVYLGLVHRLDRMTEGVMVFTKTSKAAMRLSKDISLHNENFTKKYLAVVNGKFLDNNKHILKNYMMIDEKNGISCIINDANNEKSKEAVLYYQKIGEYNNTSLVVIELVTGRHHQIRLQLANINHPILGDVLYGDNTRKLPLALACFVLTFFHPITKEKLQFTHEPYNALFTTFLLQKNIKESIICKK